MPREEAATFCAECERLQPFVMRPSIVGIIEKRIRDGSRARIIDKPRILEIVPKKKPAPAT
jgi:hypothetical protein